MTDILKILLVDDSPFDRGMVRRELRLEFGDVDIHEATDENELAETLASQVFDLVITDYQIRWTDGIKVLRRVKERLPNCPVLMFTATGSEEIAVQAMKAGLDDYILKNVNHMVRLRVAARTALEHSRMRTRAKRLETRLSALLSHLQVGVFRRSSDGTILEANDAAARILGHVSAGDLVGKNLANYLSMSSTLKASVISDQPVVDVEFSGRRVDGTGIWLAVNESRVSADDSVAVIEGLLEDISSRKQSEEDLLRLQDEIAHVSRIHTMAEMAAGISHELNQPLTVITSFASLCVDKLNEPETSPQELSGWLQKIHDLALESGQVIRGLNDFTRHRPRNPVPTDICQLIRGTIDMLRFELRRTATVPTLDLPDQQLVLNIDPVQIRQVLLNLLKNSVDAMIDVAAGNRHLSVSVSVGNKHVSVAFQDNGSGIPSERMDQLFEPFVTNKERGIGIGLSITANIVRAHGGTIDARNNEDSGATFKITLPMRPAADSTAGQSE